MKQKNANTTGAVLWTVLSCAIHIALFRNKIDLSLPVISRLLFFILAVMITLPLHEIIHCVFMMAVGLKNARVRFGRDPLGIPSLRSVAGGEVHGSKRVIFLAAPFLLLTVIPDIIFFLSEKIFLLFFIMSVCNLAGCYFDLTDIAGYIAAEKHA